MMGVSGTPACNITSLSIQWTISFSHYIKTVSTDLIKLQSELQYTQDRVLSMMYFMCLVH